MNRDHVDFGDMEDLFSNVKEISSLAHYARCQAQEAEMRANYSCNLAESAALEAQAVRIIAQSLTKTARSVAKMSLEHINKMNAAEYRSFKRGDILSAVRNNSERSADHHRNTTPTPPSSRRTPQSPKTLKREALSEETVVRTPLTKEDKSPKADETQRQGSKDSTNSGSGISRTTSPSSALFQNAGSDFLDNSDLLVCVESLHRQTSGQSSSHFTETFPDTDDGKAGANLVKDFDSTEKLPIVWEDSYQGQAGRRPMAWCEKKSIRKIQRKLRDLEVDEEQGEAASEGEGKQRDRENANSEENPGHEEIPEDIGQESEADES